jgi:hypothetical protein
LEPGHIHPPTGIHLMVATTTPRRTVEPRLEHLPHAHERGAAIYASAP